MYSFDYNFKSKTIKVGFYNMVEDWYSLFEKEIQGLNEEVFKLLEKEYIDIVDSLAQPLLDGL